MQRRTRFRMIVFICFIVAMMAVFALRLYKLQAAVSEEDLVAADADSMTYRTTHRGLAREHPRPERQCARFEPREL